MKPDVIRIGNSRGIRLPATMLKQCGIGAKVEIEVRDNEFVVKPIPSPRQGWADAFQKMHEYGDDKLIIPDEFDAE